MTSSNGNIFHITGPLWGNPPVTGGFPSQRPVTQSFDVFFELCVNKRWNKQSRCRWFETPSHSLWRHCNVTVKSQYAAVFFFWVATIDMPQHWVTFLIKKIFRFHLYHWHGAQHPVIAPDYTQSWLAYKSTDIQGFLLGYTFSLPSINLKLL